MDCGLFMLGKRSAFWIAIGLALSWCARIPNLRGAAPWVLVDFRSPVRNLPGMQDGYNRKGLISDQGAKKAAFYVLQKAYKAEGFGRAQ